MLPEDKCPASKPLHFNEFCRQGSQSRKVAGKERAGPGNRQHIVASSGVMRWEFTSYMQSEVGRGGAKAAHCCARMRLQ